MDGKFYSGRRGGRSRKKRDGIWTVLRKRKKLAIDRSAVRITSKHHEIRERREFHVVPRLSGRALFWPGDVDVIDVGGLASIEASE